MSGSWSEPDPARSDQTSIRQTPRHETCRKTQDRDGSFVGAVHKRQDRPVDNRRNSAGAAAHKNAHACRGQHVDGKVDAKPDARPSHRDTVKADGCPSAWGSSRHGEARPQRPHQGGMIAREAVVRDMRHQRVPDRHYERLNVWDEVDCAPMMLSTRPYPGSEYNFRFYRYQPP